LVQSDSAQTVIVKKSTNHSVRGKILLIFIANSKISRKFTPKF